MHLVAVERRVQVFVVPVVHAVRRVGNVAFLLAFLLVLLLLLVLVLLVVLLLVVVFE